MAMLRILIELRKRYSNVRYIDAVIHNHVMYPGKVEQWYGHVIFADAANAMLWPC